MTDFAELHSHLYGCLTVDDLYFLAKRNTPRWQIFVDSWTKAHGSAPIMDGLMDPSNRGLLEKHYHFKRASDFPKFQACFDLIIALSSTEPEELREIALRVAAREPAKHAEYRQLLSPFLPVEDFKARMRALALAFEESNRANRGKIARLAVSLPRRIDRAREYWKALQEIMEEEAVARQIVGVDFCSQEEGNPPQAIKPVLEEIHAFNRANPDKALAILYHVGESFSDKSVESAVRWIVQAARFGCHRLGHAIALGIDPQMYGGTTRMEILSERVDQIRFELAEIESLNAVGIKLDPASLKAELSMLEKQMVERPDELVPIRYDEQRLANLRAFQDWAMQEIRKTTAIIESCPTSNLRIAAIQGRHPIHRFIDADLPVVIGADDPGIFDTDLPREFDILVDWGFSGEELARLKARSLEVTSEKLVRRK
ncbi:MAG: hypothetical protein JNM27_06580 [Leptospirales bacterium]|nr:hypothetical protein [Leptospirales bacterium]